MDPFVSPQQQDEGYSEDPLSSSASNSFSADGQDEGSLALARLTKSPDFPAWLSGSIAGLTMDGKTQLAMALLDGLPTSVVADIVRALNPRLYIDFIRYLPPEVCLKILGYLDPVSLVSVARACRSWYILALDRKLWHTLYHMEGWKAIQSEIEAWENRANGGPPAGQRSVQRIQSSDDGHANKKRAISTPPKFDDDHDMVMADADGGIKQEPMDMDITESSIFGGPASATPGTGLTLHMRDLQMHSSDSKGKGKARAVSSLLKPDPVKPDSAPVAGQPEIPPILPKSTPLVWDASQQRYRTNWKFLYSMRRRLESNWEHGKYTNFQLPHPDFPLEGHSECIYSLQFNSKYLVSGSRDKSLRIWDLRTRRLVRQPLEEHKGSVLCLQFDSDPEEDIIVSGSSDSNVIVWRFSTGEVIQRLSDAHHESVLNVKFDKRILVTCSKDKSIKIFNRRTLKHGDMGYEGVVPVPFAMHNYGYDLSSALDQLPLVQPYTMIGSLDGHGAAVNAVQIYDREVVSASGDRHVKVWDWPNKVCTRTIVGHNKGIACVQYDGRRIVSGSSDCEVKVFDRQTGLEVASLRSHSDLVRTVQAGFGDLPYSVDEDLEEAKRVDQEYFKAVESGAVPSTPSRGRPGNAGSRRPEDITSYGAKLPPGGGGGKYGRIVSGSYDATIIIWRRDKEGVWFNQHCLRHEEAAVNARPGASRHLGPTVAHIPLNRPPVSTIRADSAPAATQAGGGGTSTGSGGVGSGSSAQPAPATSQSQPQPPARTTTPPQSLQVTQVESPIMATLTPSSIASFRSMIDLFVPQGPQSLAQALASYPSMLTQQEHLDAAIEREASPFVRSQLRQVVGVALMRTRVEQARQREAAMQSINSGVYGSTPTTGAGGPGPSSAAARSAVPSTANSTGHDGAGSSQAGLSTATPAQPVTAASTSGVAGASTNLRAPHQPQIRFRDRATQHQRDQLLQHPPHPQQTANAAAPAQGQAPVPVATPAAPAASATPAAPGAASVANPARTTLAAVLTTVGHHAAVPPENRENTHQVRVFKLQFDAKRIICCSQTSVIVGWDFCNGDPELEEVSELFAPLE